MNKNGFHYNPVLVSQVCPLLGRGGLANLIQGRTVDHIWVHS